MTHYQPIPAEQWREAHLITPLSPLVRLGPIDDLELALAESWLGVSQATYRFLSLLREFDLRQGYRSYGCNDCAEWMDFKLKISRKTALEKMRVAKALWFIPEIDHAFKAGQLSYSQVRALTRVADESNEAALLERALTTTACDLEKYCQRLRQGDEVSGQHDAQRQRQKRALHLLAEEGSLTAQLPVDDLALVQLALERLVEQLPEDPDRDYFAARADALVLMARQVLDQDQKSEQETEADTQSRRQILVHVEASALDGQGGEADYPLPTIRRLCCAGEVVPILKDGDQVLNVGRRQRIVPNKLKKALAARDRDCQFPGCHHTQFLDAHHIKHWCEGGETSLDNLILLCTHHHKLLHEGGFRLQPRAGKFYFARPDGRPVESPSSAEDAVAGALLE